VSAGPSAGVPDLGVGGGAGGIRARYDDLERLGRLYGHAGGRLLEAAWDDKLEAADGDLVASALLSPRTFAEAEAGILVATHGPRGLVARAAGIEAQSLCFVACVRFYRSADEARHAAIETLHYGVGWTIGVNLPGVLLVGGLAYGGARLAGADDADVVAQLEDHPEVVETVVGGGGGLLDGMSANPATAPVMRALGLAGFHPDTGAAADDLGALLFGRYEGEVDATYPRDEFSYDAPTDLGDLLDDLSGTAGDDVADGVISVQELRRPDGSVRYVVQLPGTDDFVSDTAIRNMGSNLDLVAGDDTAYGEAVRDALATAGVPDDAPVMLVGHSQGGMQAAALAADPGFDFHVTHVVTAGSPVATAGVPDEVTVLSLENTGDVVPLLDGEPNPDRAHHTTVQADVHTGSLGAEDGQNHSLSSYGRIADAADASDHPSLTAVLSGMREAGFLADPDEQVGSTTWSFRTQQGEQLRPAEIREPGTLLGRLGR
jgi:hypothetical protein